MGAESHFDREARADAAATATDRGDPSAGALGAGSADSGPADRGVVSRDDTPATLGSGAAAEDVSQPGPANFAAARGADTTAGTEAESPGSHAGAGDPVVTPRAEPISSPPPDPASATVNARRVAGATVVSGGDPREATALRAAFAIPGYEILGELGRGGMGVVYQARQVRLNRLCALKVILAGVHADPVTTVRFLAEAEAVARLQHPNIVQIHATGEADGRPFLELEYLPGDSLAQGLDGTPWPARRAAVLVEALARGIAEAHRRGVVHRDLKPGNILLDADGTPKIADFGLAKSLGSESGLTATEAILGTPSYMAPEQAEGKTKHVGPLADVYALGVILYELLTGRPPFRGATVLETLEQVKMAEPVPPSRLVPGLPRDIETIGLKCLQKPPERRYASASALADDLRRFLEGRPISARPVSPVERLARWCRRNPVVASLAGLAAVLMALIAAVSLVGYARTSAALASERAARREAVGNLYRSLAGEARALRTARVGGYREEVLKRLGRAARLDTPALSRAELRREAVASLGDFVGLRPLSLQDSGSPVSRIALDPRSELIAVGHSDGTIRLHDRTSGRVLARLPGPRSGVAALAFSPGGRLLIGHEDGTIRVAGEPATSPLRVTEKPRARGRAVRFFRVGVGRTIVVSRLPETQDVVIRDLDRSEDGEAMLGGRVEFEEGTSGDLGIHAISPDGRLMAAHVREGGLEGQGRDWIALLDLGTHRVVRRAPWPPFDGGPRTLGFSPDGTRLASGCFEGFVVLDAADLRPRLEVRMDEVPSIAFVGDGKTLAVVSIHSRVVLWNLDTNREVAVLEHPGTLSGGQVAVSDDGRTLGAASPGAVHVWDLAGTSERLALAGHSRGVTNLAFRPDGSALASTGKDATVKLWDPADGRLIRTLGGSGSEAQACAFSPDGSLLAAGSMRMGWLRLWDTATWEEVYSDTAGLTTGLAFSRGGREGHDLLAASGLGVRDGARWRRGGRIWRVGRMAGGRVALEDVLSQDEDEVSVALSPGGAFGVFASRAGRIRVWDLDPVRERPFSGPDLVEEPFYAVAFRSPEEVVYVTRDGTVVVWDVVTDRRVRAVGRPGTFESQIISVSPDGRWMAVPGGPTSVAVVDLERGESAFNLREEDSPIWSLAWSPNARRLAVGLSDGGLVIWDLDAVRSLLAGAGLD